MTQSETPSPSLAEAWSPGLLLSHRVLKQKGRDKTMVGIFLTQIKFALEFSAGEYPSSHNYKDSRLQKLSFH